jgi:hypothetical protein
MAKLANAFCMAVVVVGTGCQATPELRQGMSLREAKGEFQHGLVHQFTTKHDGAVFSCYSPSRIEGSNHYLIFRQGAYSHATDVPAFDYEWKYVDGRPISKLKLQRNSLQRMNEVLEHEPAEDPFRPIAQPTWNQEQGGSMRPLFFMMLPLLPIQAVTLLAESVAAGDEELFSNRELELVKPGTERAHVHAALGAPLKLIQINQNEAIELYATIPTGEPPDLSPCKCMAIRFEGDVVHDLLSNDFIDENWMD